jgi:hypothetical protein
MMDAEVLNQRRATVVRSFSYFSIDITDLRELHRSHFNRATCHSHSPLDFKMLADQNKIKLWGTRHAHVGGHLSTAQTL